MTPTKRGLLLLIFIALSISIPRPAAAEAPVLLSGKQRLGLRALDVKAEIVENIVRTTLEMTFFNNEDRQLEGTLYFPLPTGATVSSFGMYFGDVLRPGVVVEKEQGRVIYESIKRRRIDPALVELESGNKFKARVFPIPAKGEKRVQIAYEEDLLAKDGGNTYVLPLDYGLTLKNFRLKLTLKSSDAQEIAPSGALAEKLLLQKEDSGRRWDGAINEENVKLEDALRLTIKSSQEKALSVWTEREKDGVSFFRVTYNPGLKPAPRKPASNLLILWDTSLSGQKRDLERDLTFLEGLLKKEAGSVSYRVASFNLTVTELTKGYSPLSKGAIPDVLKALKGSVYDGATDLTGLMKALPALLGTEGKTDVLIFSDFINSYSGDVTKEDIEAAAGAGATFFPVTSSSVKIPTLISALAGMSGGKALDLISAGVPGNALTTFSITPPYLTGIVAPTWTDEIYPKGAQDASGRVVFVGRYTKGGPVDFQLNFSVDGQSLTRRVTAELPAEPEEGELLKRVWAKSKVAELLEAPTRYAKEIVSLGRAYSIVTPYTSLIVLDRYEDYKNYGLTPPPDVVKEWEETQKEFKPGQSGPWPRRLEVPVISGGGPVTIPPAPQPDVAPSEAPPPSTSSGYSWHEGQAAMMDVGPGGYGGWGPPTRPPRPLLPQEAQTVEIKVEPAYYEKVLKEAFKNSPEEAYKTYLKIREKAGQQIPFYLFSADLFNEAGKKPRAELILSNVVELHPDTAAYVRVFAHRIRQWGEEEKAVPFFERVVRLRGEEPQSYRDLGMALAASGRHREALEQLQMVLDKKWDSRFKDVKSVVRQDIGWIAEKTLKKLPRNSDEYLEISSKYLEGYRRPELRVILAWDADNTDIDLWVTEPSGEKCYYGNRVTKSGGQISDDLTMGYGPEAYTIEDAQPGTYKIQAHYYATDRTILLEGTSVQVTVIKNLGTDREEVSEHTVYLKKTKQVIDIASVEMGK